MTAAEPELPVIFVNAIADSSGVCGSGMPRRDLARLVVPVSDVRKSAEFYRRVFGFRPRSTWSGIGVGGGSLLLAARGRTELWLRPRCMAPDEAAQTRRWAFGVTNLEKVREKVWELGVKVARDSGEPDHIFRRRAAASLYVRDPDGNEIELVETNRRDRPRPLPPLVAANRGKADAHLLLIRA